MVKVKLLSACLCTTVTIHQKVCACSGAVSEVFVSNGSVFGEVLTRYYAKHTSGIVISNLKEQIEDTYDQIPLIKERISILQDIEALGDYEEQIPKVFGKAVTDYVEEQPKAENAWLLYNQLTHYISHYVQQRMRASYQMKVSKMFQL